MARFKKFTFLYCIGWLLLIFPGVCQSAISLTINGSPDNSVTLSPGQSCSIEIVSNNSVPYTAYIGFGVPDTLGPLTHTATLPQAGTSAMVEPFFEAPLSIGYRVMAMGGPTPGVHFTFLYEAYTVGQVTLGLWNSNSVLVDSVQITVTQSGLGACCNPITGSCYMSEVGNCEPGWSWLGTGTDCNSCHGQQPEYGACCDQLTGTCSITELINCTFTWLGGGTDCNSCHGQQPMEGACCNPATGECTMTLQENCPYNWLGAGSSCSSCQQQSVEIKRFEINQCFQDVCSVDHISQRYDLIETKPFIVDVNLQLTSSPPDTVNAKVKLEIFNSSGASIAKKEKGSVEIKRSEEVKCTLPQFIFAETKEMKAGDYKFSIRVEDYSGKKLLERDLTYTFKSAKTVKVLVIPKIYITRGPGSEWLLFYWSDRYLNFAEQVFPFPKRTAKEVNRLEIEYCVPLFAGHDPNYRSLLAVLNRHLTIWNSNRKPPDTTADFICAIVSNEVMPKYLGVRQGQAILIKSQADNKIGVAQETLGHEMGHIFGLGEEYISSDPNVASPWILDQRFEFSNNPPPVKLASGPFKIAGNRPNEGQFCDWADNPDTYCPQEQRPADANKTYWWCEGRYLGNGGYEVENSVESKRKVHPKTISMMSGGDAHCWISGPEYKSLRKTLTPSVPKAMSTGLSSLVSPLSDGQRVLISGMLNISQHTAELNPIVPVQNLELSEEADDANCMLVFKSGTGEVLADFNVAPLESEELYSLLEGSFSAVVDLPTNTACIQIIIDNAVADEVFLTSNSPAVEILSPNGGEEISSGEFTVTWTASDADVNDINDLRYTMEFSHNNGADWNILAMDLDVNEIVIDSNNLPGDPNCLIKVTASDGWNLSSDISDAPFSVATKPPQVTILDPEDGAAIMESSSMQGRCSAYDPETGDINDPNAIIWSSSIDGFLGKGDLTGFQLSLGRHILSATVTDPEGRSSSDSVIVRVIVHPADFNFDRFINFLDVAIFAAEWRNNCLEPHWCEGVDIDSNGTIDSADLQVVAENWLWQQGQ